MQRGVLMLNQEDYINHWMRKKPEWTRSMALAKWEADKDNRDIYRDEDSDGELELAVKMPREIIGRQGVCNKRGLGTCIQGDEHSADFALISNKNPQQLAGTVVRHHFRRCRWASLEARCRLVESLICV